LYSLPLIFQNPKTFSPEFFEQISLSMELLNAVSKPLPDFDNQDKYFTHREQLTATV
jgi:hypothetical protein